MDTETIAMTIIAHAGEALDKAFQALDEAKKGNFDRAKELMEESRAESTAAHRSQTELLVAEANDKKLEINVLLIHSQDHLMTSMMAQQLIKEMIWLHENKADKAN